MDPKLLKTLKELDAYTLRELLRLNDDIRIIYEKYLRDGKIQDSSEMLREIDRRIMVWGGLFAAGLIGYQLLASRRALDQNNKILKNVFKKYASNKKSSEYLDDLANITSTSIGEKFMSRKFPGTNVTTERRLKTIIDGSQRTVRNIVNVGIKEGTPTWEIAKQIEAYIKPDLKTGLRVAPWTIARRELGKPTSYIPTGMPAGSVEYNAMRIARTETVSTYQQAPYLAHKDKWYYNGIKWHLSNSHPEPDECDEYAEHQEGMGKGVWKICPAIPHPHCICWTEVLMADPATMVKMFKTLNW